MYWIKNTLLLFEVPGKKLAIVKPVVLDLFLLLPLLSFNLLNFLLTYLSVSKFVCDLSDKLLVYQLLSKEITY